eukprot:TRINITY_DN53283_c0_g1_i1.p1 TRINITY_DN53283_c0_g1~~TRINITY_DN53283_c0_g1_i1.p1  ORF type:complete len:322 (+),score=35.27 TRINITY_DN53283_c0_g1_i1:142-1107(+)
MATTSGRPSLEAAVRSVSGRLLGVQGDRERSEGTGSPTEATRLVRSNDVPRGRSSRFERGSPEGRARRASFRDTREQIIGEVAQDVTPLRCAATVLATLIAFFFVYVETRSIIVLLQTRNSTCDAPLWGWLFVRLCLIWFTSMCGQTQTAIRVAWVLLGYQWLSEAHSCQETAAPLYTWVKFVLTVDVVWISALVALPFLVVLGVLTFVFLVEHGYVANPRAARPDTLEALEKVEFREDLFSRSDESSDTRPSIECCCCYEDFCADKAIVRTPCKHYFHKACLADWLKLAKTCPLCRCDLDEAAMAHGGDKSADARTNTMV